SERCVRSPCVRSTCRHVTRRRPVRRTIVQIRILVVDDEQDNCDFFHLLLTREGYEVTCETDPTKVMDLVRQETLHLVVLDMMMRLMAGSGLLGYLRNADSDVDVIVGTAYPHLDSAVESLKLQASGYVKKPVEPQECLDSVAAALA